MPTDRALMSAIGERLTPLLACNTVEHFSMAKLFGPFAAAPSAYLYVMSLRCLVRLHRPMLNSIVRREDRYTALCDNCGLPIERQEGGRWTEAPSLVSRGDQA